VGLQLILNTSLSFGANYTLFLRSEV